MTWYGKPFWHDGTCCVIRRCHDAGGFCLPSARCGRRRIFDGAECGEQVCYEYTLYEPDAEAPDASVGGE